MPSSTPAPAPWWSATRCLRPARRPAGGAVQAAVRPVALRCVTEVRAALPDAGRRWRGIMTADDACSFLAAGTVAVQVGTALLHDPYDRRPPGGGLTSTRPAPQDTLHPTTFGARLHRRDR